MMSRGVEDGYPASYATLYSLALSPIDKASGMQASDYSGIASLGFLFYDICLTFADEVKIFWSRPWYLTKFLYYFIRYVPLFVQASLWAIGTPEATKLHFTQHDCYIWQTYQGVATITITTAVDTILILRIFALYFDVKAIRIILVFLLIVEVVSMSIGFALTLPHLSYDEVCVAINVPRAVYLYVGASIIFQVILFLLTLFKFLLGLRQGWRGIHIASLLMRDGTWGFFLLMALLIGQCSLLSLKNQAYDAVLICWQMSCYSFVGYRILLNLNRPQEATQWDSTALSAEFAVAPVPDNNETDISTYELTRTVPPQPDPEVHLPT